MVTITHRRIKYEQLSSQRRAFKARSIAVITGDFINQLITVLIDRIHMNMGTGNAFLMAVG